MEIYRKDILVILGVTTSVGYVFGSFVKVIRRDEKRFGMNERRMLDMNERFISSLHIVRDFKITDYSIIVRIANDGDYFDMPDTRLRINMNEMVKGQLSSEVRRHISDGERPVTKIFAATGESVKVFFIAAITRNQPEGNSVFDNVFQDVTDEQVKKLQKLKKEQKKVIRPKISASTSNSEDTSGQRVMTDSDSAQLKAGVLFEKPRQQRQKSEKTNDSTLDFQKTPEMKTGAKRKETVNTNQSRLNASASNFDGSVSWSAICEQQSASASKTAATGNLLGALKLSTTPDVNARNNAKIPAKKMLSHANSERNINVGDFEDVQDIRNFSTPINEVRNSSLSLTPEDISRAKDILRQAKMVGSAPPKEKDFESFFNDKRNAMIGLERPARDSDDETVDGDGIPIVDEDEDPDSLGYDHDSQ